MKIALFDNTIFKFSRALIEHWESLGHTVVKDKMFDPKICVDADVIFFDWADANVARASNENDSLWEQIEGGQLKNKKVIVRAHDIEIWTGQPSTVNWWWVNDLVFVAEHTMKHCDSYMHFAEKYPNLKIHLIKHGTDPNKYTYRELENKKIAWGSVWNDKKNGELALAILAELPRDFELYMVGPELKNWRKAYVMNYIERLQLNVKLYDFVPDINEWLDDKGILLHTGMKEAYCFLVSEAALKGIKPVVRHFYGAENVWPESILFDTVSQAKDMILGGYFPKEYRNMVERDYSFQKMLNQFDKLLGL